MKRVGIYAKKHHPSAVGCGREVMNWLAGRGIEVLLEEDLAKSLGKSLTTPTSCREQFSGHGGRVDGGCGQRKRGQQDSPRNSSSRRPRSAVGGSRRFAASLHPIGETAPPARESAPDAPRGTIPG